MKSTEQTVEWISELVKRHIVMKSFSVERLVMEAYCEGVSDGLDSGKRIVTETLEKMGFKKSEECNQKTN